MKTVCRLFMLVIAISLITACSSDSDVSDDPAVVPTITIASSDFTIDAEQGSEAKATFSINVDWKTTAINYEGDTKNWLTITPTAGKSGSDRGITMTAIENPAEAERKASFAITYGGKEEKLTITQQGIILVPTITVATSEFAIDYAQDSEAKATFSINVDWKTSAISYEAEGDKDWLEITPVEGKSGKDQSITMKVLENSNVERKASFTINYGDAQSHKFTVTQSSKLMADITTHFDVKFAAKLQEKDYIKNATKILFSDVIGIDKLEIGGTNTSSGGLTSLAGIEYLESLTVLNCTFNEITTLDVSKNLALTELSCTGNKLTTLDVSKNTELSYFACASNQLTKIDVSKNTKIYNLQVNNNPITTLDVTSLTALTRLTCNNCQITALDLSNSPNLVYLQCTTNKIATFDVSKNTKLTQLLCGMNLINELDVSAMPALNELLCTGNNLTTLDVSKNTKLTALACVSNQLTTLKVNDLTALMIFQCSNNKLTELDVSNNKNLLQVICSSNKLTELNISNNTRVTKFHCSNNQITTLDVSKNTKLTELKCENNPGAANSFIVKATFDNDNIPSDKFTKGNWIYETQTITIDYQKQ